MAPLSEPMVPPNERATLGTEQQLPPAAQRLNQMLLGQFQARALALVAELGIADLLHDGPLSIEDLAARTRSNPDALYRVLRALAATEVFIEQAEKTFANTELSECLRNDVAGSLASMARWLGDISGWSAWARLDHSVRTGEPAFNAVFGSDCFTWLESHPESLGIFQRAMTGYSHFTAGAVAEAYDFSSIGTLLDVGGGHGTFLSLLLDRFPRLRGVLYDRPEVIERAEPELRERGHADRVRAVAGNFLEGVPEGADAIVLKHIVHDWDDAHCATLLGQCRKSLPAGGRLLVVESVLSDHPDAAFAKFLDLEMLVVTPGGRERTAAEFARLLSGAGFALTAVLPTRSPVCVIEAVAR
jgi:hypothetical protein